MSEGPRVERVLISGMGPLTCLGLGLDELADGIAEASVMQGTARLDARGRNTPGLVPEFAMSDFISTSRPYLDLQSKCALAAAALALDAAAVEHDEVDPLRCGLAYATTWGNFGTQSAFQRAVAEKGMRLASPVLFSHAYPNSSDGLVAIEFGLRGVNQNLCGDALCGAQALEAAMWALGDGQADMVLAGGADVLAEDVLSSMRAQQPADVPAPSQGVGLLLLETQDSVERREGYAYCELSAVVCTGTGGSGAPPEVGRALRHAIEQAVAQAGIWQGDIAVVGVCADTFAPELIGIEAKALRGYAQVPVVEPKRYLGETFAAGFPLACMVATEVLTSGTLPSQVTYQGRSKGVELWVERKPESLLGSAALVVGATTDMVAAAVLRAL